MRYVWVPLAAGAWLGLSISIGVRAWGETPSSQPETSGSSMATGSSDLSDIMERIRADNDLLHLRFPVVAEILDVTRKDEARKFAAPVMRSLVDDFRALETADPKTSAMANTNILQLLTLGAVAGDPDAAAALEAQSRGPNLATACAAQAGLLVVDWCGHRDDAMARSKVLDQFEALVEKMPNSDGLAPFLFYMRHPNTGPIGDRSRIDRLVRTKLKGPVARRLASESRDQVARGEIEGNPPALSGVLSDGSKFSASQWTGRVIIVDFWATWCAPCRASIPRLKQLYGERHKDGLEIIGVSCDSNLADLLSYLANEEIPWPQFFDADHPGWHALAGQCHVSSLPSVFVIDRQGNWRRLGAGEDLEGVVNQLLGKAK